MKERQQRVLAIASGGGHFEQLVLLREALDGYRLTVATTLPGLAESAGLPGAYLVPDCNRTRPAQAVWCFLVLLWLILRVRPHAVVSTGALPGVIALAIARRLGAKTVWVDSVANAEELSMAGTRARRHADLWMSQWASVAHASGAEYAGSVL